jgi:hypothetical protein
MHEYAKIPTAFRKGTIWFIISTSWVLKWQRYVYFDCIDAEEEAVSEEGREHPGEVDCSDIVESEAEKGLGEDSQVKRGMKEGVDYIIVDENFATVWTNKYKVASVGPVQRHAIVESNEEEDPDAKAKVEVRLK